MEIKINIGQEDGKTVQLSLQESKALYGKKIGETIKGELLDKSGYEFIITGGSNASGVPMRADVDGIGQRKILLAGGVGYRPKRAGIRARKTVCGNTVGPKTAQLNMKVTKTGPKPLVAAPEEPATEE